MPEIIHGENYDGVPWCRSYTKERKPEDFKLDRFKMTTDRREVTCQECLDWLQRGGRG